MKKLFIPYELAKTAHRKGFPNQTGSCLAAWEITDNAEWLHFGAHPVGLLQAPLYGQIVDWFREKHNIMIHVESCFNADKYSTSYCYTIYGITKDNVFKASSSANEYVKKIHWLEGNVANFRNEDYHTALNKGIEEAFKLI